MHAVYLSHNGMTEPLGQRQVLPYLRGLGQAGVRIDLLACEPPGADPAAIAALRQELLPFGVRYTALSRRPATGLLAKLRDCGQLFLVALRRLLATGGRPRLIHARSHLPSAVADALCHLLPRARFLFDCRGLLAEEYADLGHWQRGGLRYRLTDWAQGRLFQRADRVVVLTDALRRELCDGPLLLRNDDIVVIPCCVDTERFRPDPLARARRRAELGVADDTKLVAFAGSLSRYDLAATAALIAQLRRHGDARLLLVTRDDPQRLLSALSAVRCAGALHRVSATADEVPGWLAAADLSVSLLLACRSSIAASPTKLAEALSAGLPVVVSRNVADNNRLTGGGIFAPEPDPAEQATLAGVAARIMDRLREPQTARDEARQAALRHFSLKDIGVVRYRALYEQLS